MVGENKVPHLSLNFSKIVIAHADLPDNHESDQIERPTVPDNAGELV